MEKLILLRESEARQKIQKTFGVTPANVSQSLTFARNGAKNQRMRVMAMQHGGVLLCEKKDWTNNDLK